MDYVGLRELLVCRAEREQNFKTVRKTSFGVSGNLFSLQRTNKIPNTININYGGNKCNVSSNNVRSKIYNTHSLCTYYFENFLRVYRCRPNNEFNEYKGERAERIDTRYTVIFIINHFCLVWRLPRICIKC